MKKIEKIEILLVEDDADDAEMTILAIKELDEDIKVIHLHNGVEALDFLLRKNKNINNLKVILLDLKLPMVNGFEVLEKIKVNENTKTVPVVMLTSSTIENDVRKAYQLHANSYVIKPIGFEKYMDTVTNLVKYWKVFNKTF